MPGCRRLQQDFGGTFEVNFFWDFSQRDLEGIRGISFERFSKHNFEEMT